ncbi:MAG: hypothetical protein A2Z42_04435 [Candidatus Woykebacteria bacterium RBG_19FT_COMBO_43_10]|uniref:Uncharacterized protein n=1 Tax=Candidatus Woykebacteria bacterium RBG_19FT_COMBO_43_10 TaxID=1802598 RepID=A0A1G1WGJ4_9BACT|nr:MAG: hypothetical protein A2Z42_04435 [Candidatus Woykebacteria bacterium RBG_19FT_COMBO_43_10]
MNTPLDPNAIVIWILGTVLILSGIVFAVGLGSFIMVLMSLISYRKSRDLDPEKIAGEVDKDIREQMQTRIRNRR